MYKLSRQNGVTALYVASRNGRVEVVNILLQNGAHVDVQDEVEVFIFHICSTDRAVKLKAMYVSQNMTVTSLLDLMLIFACSGQVDSSDDSISKWAC